MAFPHNCFHILRNIWQYAQLLEWNALNESWMIFNWPTVSFPDTKIFKCNKYISRFQHLIWLCMNNFDQIITVNSQKCWVKWMLAISRRRYWRRRSIWSTSADKCISRLQHLIWFASTISNKFPQFYAFWPIKWPVHISTIFEKHIISVKIRLMLP